MGGRTEWTRARAHVCDGGGRRVCVCMHASVNVGTDACACGTARLYSRGRACPIPCAIIIHKPRQGCKGEPKCRGCQAEMRVDVWLRVWTWIRVGGRRANVSDCLRASMCGAYITTTPTTATATTTTRDKNNNNNHKTQIGTHKTTTTHKTTNTKNGKSQQRLLAFLGSCWHFVVFLFFLLGICWGFVGTLVG